MLGKLGEATGIELNKKYYFYLDMESQQMETFQLKESKNVSCW